jgi:hypothetical protein
MLPPRPCAECIFKPKVVGSIPTAPTKPQETKAFLYAESAFRGSISNWSPPITPAKASTAVRCD